MARASRTPRLPAAVAQAADAVRWYYRTRPDAWRELAAPGLGAFLAFWLSIAWGPFGPLLALLVVSAFSVFAIRLIEEMRSFETEASASIEFEAGDLPWLARRVATEPTQPPTKAAVAEAVEHRAAAEFNPPSLSTLAPSVEPALASTLSGSEEPRYELRDGTIGTHGVLQTAASFLDASDLAFELIEQDDPAELEIVCVTGTVREIVWSYRRSEPAAEIDAQGPVDAAVLDVSRWTKPRS
jgi:hypothetical protein